MTIEQYKELVRIHGAEWVHKHLSRSVEALRARLIKDTKV